MSLTQIMSSMRLSVYAEIALVLFAVVFAAVVARTWSARSRGEMARAARLPLEEDPAQATPAPSAGGGAA